MKAFCDTQHNDAQHNNTLPLCYVSHLIYCYSESPNAECHYAQRRYAECRYGECHYDEIHYSESHNGECHSLY